MAAVSICSDFGAQKNKVSNCFLCLPIYLPWSHGTRCHGEMRSPKWLMDMSPWKAIKSLKFHGDTEPRDLNWEAVLENSVQFSSVTQSCPTLCHPMNCSTPGLPVHHQLPKFTQTHVHRVGDAIQPSHPLLSPSPPALNLSQHHSLFQWVSSSHEVAKLLEFQL